VTDTSPPEHATLFVTCLVDSLFPEVGESATELLAHLGVSISFPSGQTCCGQPAYNSGYWADARKMAKHTIEVLEEAQGPVICPSGSCSAMIIHGYPELFRDDPDWRARAEELAPRTRELTQFIVDDLGIKDVGAAMDAEVVYHPACHGLRSLGIDRQPKELLNHVDGLRILQQDDPATCCGFGGTFSIRMGDISTAMLRNRVCAFEAAKPDIVVTIDVSCMMHLEGGLRKVNSLMHCVHIADFLAAGLDH
jgi:L-lactate dehydrogenase complex protein LldE